MSLWTIKTPPPVFMERRVLEVKCQDMHGSHCEGVSWLVLNDRILSVFTRTHTCQCVGEFLQKQSENRAHFTLALRGRLQYRFSRLNWIPHT